MWQVFRLNFFQLTILYLFSFNIVHLKPPDRTILGLKHKLKREETSHELDFNDCNYLNESNLRRIYSSDQMNNKITQCDLIITVKTTKQNHQNKLMNIIQTWFNLIQSKVFIVSDDKDELISNLTNNRLVETNCENSHARDSLICKLSAEFQIFSANQARWYCHADDDTYFNVERLYQTLSQYDSAEPWYIGRISISQKINLIYDKKAVEFSFATGGAGYCISNGLATKLAPFVKPNILKKLSKKIGVPDDVLLGFIIEILLKVPLTENDRFHSHLEYLGVFNETNLKDQISLSYSHFHENLVNVKQKIENDPTRFKSIHCHLYPKEKLCNL